MIKILKSMVISFSMYSKIPMPQFAWNEENMRYSLLFFPMVGLVIGGMQAAVCRLLGMGNVPLGFQAAAATAVPVLVTGGIHMDGYCDTVDALASYGTEERRLEILKDPHVGAFAVIWTAIYFILSYGGWTLVKDMSTVGMIALGYAGSRSMSGLAAVYFPVAKKTGTLYAFTSVAARRTVRCGLAVVFLVTSAVQILLNPCVGTVLVLAEIFWYIYYYSMAKRKFGGITGDLEGWFLQCAELLILYICGIGAFLAG